MLPRSASLFKAHMNVCLDDFKLAWDPKLQEMMLYCFIKFGKTDQFGKGRSVSVINVPGSPLSIVNAWRAWLTVRSGWVARCSQPVAPAFIEFDSGRSILSPFDINMFSKELRIVVAAAGLSVEAIKPHSFRIGAATVLNAEHASDTAIQKFGAWNSNAFRVYVREQPQGRADLQIALANSIL